MTTSDRPDHDARDDTTMTATQPGDATHRSTRRRFLTMAGTGGALVAVAAVAPFGFDIFGHDPTLDLLGATEATFRPHLGDTFSVSGQAVRRLKLVGVRNRGDRAFSLYFEGDAGLAQGTYPLRHATLGRFDLFVVPGQVSSGIAGYEAAFNHGGIT